MPLLSKAIAIANAPYVEVQIEPLRIKIRERV